MAAPPKSSRLELLQARFQQRQLMEKEQKLLQLYDQQQQRAHQVAQRGSAGSNTSNGSGSGNTQSITRTTTTTSHTTSNSQGGKVRQMFDERRQTTVKGIDRSYPLEPLENKPRKTILPSSQRNGNGIASRHSVTVKRTIRADNNGNVNNTKPVINYHEEVTRETFGPKLIHRDEDLEEFTNENDINKWTNGNDEINSEINNEISNQGRTPERTKYGNTRKETTITKRSETFNAPRGKQESRVYRNMIEMELKRGSPELGGRVSRESLREASKSPERDHSPGIDVTESRVYTQTSVGQEAPEVVRNEKMMYTVPQESITISEIHEKSNKREPKRSPSPIIRRKSSLSSLDRYSSSGTEKSTTFKSHSEQKNNKKLVDTTIETRGPNEHVRIHKIMITEEGQSPKCSLDQLNDRKSFGSSMRTRSISSFDGSEHHSKCSLDKLDDRKSFSSPIRTRSPSPLETPEQRRSSSKISLRSLEEQKSSDDNNDIDTTPIWRDSPYPRRKSEFEKSRIFRKLQEELDRESSDEVAESSGPEGFRKEKSPSPAKYNDSFFRIKDYPRRVSQFEKSDTFAKIRKSLDEEENRGTNSKGRSASPPTIVKTSYNKLCESSGRKASPKTTFRKIQEDVDRSSPERKPAPTPQRIQENVPKKPESGKSKIFKKLQRELSATPEPKVSPDRPRCSPDVDFDNIDDHVYRHSPTRVDLQNEEVRIPDVLPKRPSFEKLRSVELLKDHLLLTENKHVSNSKYTLDDVERDLPSDRTAHRIVKKDGVRSTSPSFLKKDDRMSNKNDNVRKNSKSPIRSSPDRDVRLGSPNRNRETVIIRESSSSVKKVPSQTGKPARTVHEIAIEEETTRSKSPSSSKKPDELSRRNKSVRRTSASPSSSPIREIRESSPNRTCETVIVRESSSNIEQIASKDDKRGQMIHKIVKRVEARSPSPSIPKKDGGPSKRNISTRRTPPSPLSSPIKEVRHSSPKKTYETVIVQESLSNIEEIPSVGSKPDQTIHRIVKKDDARSRSPSLSRKNSGPSTIYETVTIRESSSNLGRSPSAGSKQGRTIHKVVKTFSTRSPSPSLPKKGDEQNQENASNSASKTHETVIIRESSTNVEKTSSLDNKPGQTIHKVINTYNTRSPSPSFSKKDDRISRRSDFVRRTSASPSRLSSVREVRTHTLPNGTHETIITRESSSSRTEEVSKQVKPGQTIHRIVEKDGASTSPSLLNHVDAPNKRGSFTYRTSTSSPTSSSVREVTRYTSPNRTHETIITRESSSSRSGNFPRKVKPGRIIDEIVREYDDDSPSTSFTINDGTPSKRDSFTETRYTSPTRTYETVVTNESSSKTEQIPIKNDKSVYERTDSVESALRKFNSIEDLTAEDAPKPSERRRSSGERRSSLHAATASWTMHIKATNQHINKNRQGTPKNHKKFEVKNTKSSKKDHEILRSRSTSPSCKKRLFTDSESDKDSKDTGISSKTITIETSTKTTTAPSEPLKVLRSIDDIRNSMTRDCQLKESSSDNLIAPQVVIRIISPNTARRTGYIQQYVESNAPKSTKSHEINVKHTRRIEKTPSPDQLRINSTERRSKNGGSGKNAEVISRPTSNESNRERLPDTPKLDSNDNRPSKSQENLSNNKKNSSAFVIDFEVEQPPRSKPNSITKKTLNNKQTPEKITIQQKSKTSSTRSPSALSTNSSCSSTNQEVGSAGSKGRMSMKPRAVTSGGNRTPSATKANNATVDSGLPACKICGRKFASDRISLHEQICAKTSQKKRKTFDPVVQRVKGTELEPFVKKISKKGNERKATKKPEVKSNWRRKHEDFINAIRSAKQMQAHLAAGGKLSDLPPPPASDTSDYIQCPHCGRKFNQAAAERHIPKCEHMLHNKPNPRAPPPKPRR